MSYDCPACGKPAMGFWRKSCLGPATKARCRECGANVSVPYKAMLAGIPFVIALLGSSFIDHALTRALILGAGSVVFLLLYIRVPLIKRD